jgi:flagellar hook-associated protein 3 FlgL
MRVSTHHFSNSLTDQLSQLSSRQNRLQTQAATGRRIQNASDDPVAMQRLVELQAESGAVTQYQANIGRLQDTSTATYSALRSLQSASDKAGVIVIRAGDMNQPEALTSYAKEITQLIKESVGALNQKFGDQHLFGGTKSGEPPFVLETDADGFVTSVAYRGNEAANEVEIAAGVTLATTIPGANTGASGPRGLVTDSRSGADFFNHLISLQNHLLAGDTQAISETDRPALETDEDNFFAHLGDIGATQTRLETAASSATARGVELKLQSSREGDADLADTLVRLSETQSAYQATIQSAAKIMSMTLMDYLR